MFATQIEPTTTLAQLQESKPESVTIVWLSGDLDRAMAAFIIIIATGAAAMGLDVRSIACTTTMGLMSITKDTLIDGINQFAGVTTYLAEAKQGSVNLFI